GSTLIATVHSRALVSVRPMRQRRSRPTGVIAHLIVLVILIFVVEIDGLQRSFFERSLVRRLPPSFVQGALLRLALFAVGGVRFRQGFLTRCRGAGSSEGSTLHDPPPKKHVRQANPAPDQPAVTEQLSDLLGLRIGRAVKILGLDADQQVTDAPAN